MSNNLLLRRRMLMQAGGSPTPPTPPEGAIPFPFSVSPTKQVYFSKGNLQWSATGGGTTPTTHVTADGVGDGTWRFAENQWDFVGDNNYGNVYGVGGDVAIKCSNNNRGANYQGWIDRFRWGANGYNNTPPYGNSYYTGDTALGDYEWGTYNAISNGGDTPSLWRSLFADEYRYIMVTRQTLTGIRYAAGNVNGYDGYLLFADDWDGSYTINNYNRYRAPCSSNVISLSDFQTIEAKGVVFLPVRQYYWLDGFRNHPSAYMVLCDSGYIRESADGVARSTFYSVRLVTDAN